MASPFSIFRKHQRVMLAGITILAMFAFVFISPWGRGNSGPGGAGGKGPEIATWKFGTIYKSDVAARLSYRRAVNEFMQNAYVEAVRKGAFSDGHRPQLFPQDDGSALTAIVLQKRAEQMGLVVGDDAINEFIDKEVTDNKLTDAEKSKIVQDLSTRGIRLSASQLFDAFRFELEAVRLGQLLRTDVGAALTPEQRFDYYSRLKRHATIQVVPVAVKDFTDKVPDPGESELQAFFEKYKDNFGSPYSPEPGFKEPVRAKFQYFQADRQELVKQEKPKVTDDEIKQYYDKHKDLFRKSSDDEGTDSSDKSKKPAATTPPDGSGKSEPKKEPEKDASDKSRTDSKDDASAAPDNVAPKPAADKSPESKPSDSKPSESKSSSGKSPDEKPRATSGKSVELVPTLRHRPTDELLALADGDASPPRPGTATKNAAKPQTTTPPPNDAAPAKDPAASKDASAKSAGKLTGDNKSVPPKAEAAKTEPANKEPGKTEPAKAEPATTQPAKSSSSGEFPDLGLKPSEPPKKIPIVEYDSLDSEKVRDKIRTTLADEKVNARIEDAFKKLSGKLSSYSVQLSSWRAKQEGEAPVPPDFKAMAKENGLKYQETGMISQQQAVDSTDLGLGKSVLFDESNGMMRQFAQDAFNPNLKLFHPYRSDAMDFEASFLWWRVGYKDAYVPTLDQVKKEVLETWKMIQAQKLALAKAKEYADQANKQHAELKEMFQFQSDMHVSTIGPFSWMRQLSVARNPEQPSQLQMTQLSGVDKAGDEFMRTVFGLDAETTGVAMNQPKTIAYVIQVSKFDPPEDTFRRGFLSAMVAPFDDSLLAGQQEAFDAYQAKLTAIQNEFDLKWVTNPSAPAATPASSDDSDD